MNEKYKVHSTKYIVQSANELRTDSKEKERKDVPKLRKNVLFCTFTERARQNCRHNNAELH